MSTSLRDLLSKAGLSESEPAPEPAPGSADAASAAAVPPFTFAPKVIVRLSRKGRGGKIATTIEGIADGAKAALKDLKRELGTGGHVDGELVVIGGDQVDRVCAWLDAHGARKVVRG